MARNYFKRYDLALTRAKPKHKAKARSPRIAPVSLPKQRTLVRVTPLDIWVGRSNC